MGFFAVATHDFKARNAKEISLRRGQRIDVIDASGKWWMARRGRDTGLVPSNYVSTKLVIRRAVYAHKAQAPHELTFASKDRVQILRDIDESWSEGVLLNGTAGIFPRHYAPEEIEVIGGEREDVLAKWKSEQQQQKQAKEQEQAQEQAAQEQEHELEREQEESEQEELLHEPTVGNTDDAAADPVVEIVDIDDVGNDGDIDTTVENDHSASDSIGPDETTPNQSSPETTSPDPKTTSPDPNTTSPDPKTTSPDTADDDRDDTIRQLRQQVALLQQERDQWRDKCSKLQGRLLQYETEQRAYRETLGEAPLPQPAPSLPHIDQKGIFAESGGIKGLRARFEQHAR